MRNMFKQLFGDGSSTDKDKGKKKKNEARDKARSGVANRYTANTDFSSARKKEARDKARSGMANKKPANTDFSASDMPTSKEMQAKRTSGATPTMAAPANINPKGMTGTAKPPVADMMRREAATAPGMAAEGMAKSVGEAKSRGADKFIGKDGTQKAAVTKEELEASGLSLRDYLNQQQGKTRRPEMKSGGMAKAYKKGGKVRGMNYGGKVEGMKSGGKVRGAGIAHKGTRACKIR